MESISEVVREYSECLKEIRHIKRDMLGDGRDHMVAGSDYLLRMVDRADQLKKKIEEYRKAAVNRVGYTVRSTFRDESEDHIPELKKDAASYRLYMRMAKKAEEKGDKKGVAYWEAKAAERTKHMSMIRRSCRRTIDTPLNVKRPTDGQSGSHHR